MKYSNVRDVLQKYGTVCPQQRSTSSAGTRGTDHKAHGLILHGAQPIACGTTHQLHWLRETNTQLHLA